MELSAVFKPRGRFHRIFLVERQHISCGEMSPMAFAALRDARTIPLAPLIP